MDSKKLLHFRDAKFILLLVQLVFKAMKKSCEQKLKERILMRK